MRLNPFRRQGGPAAAALAFAERAAAGPDGAPLHRLLDELWLPWLEARRTVERRHGISRDPLYGHDVVLFTDAERLPSFLQPWRADVFERYALDLPIVRFSGMAWSTSDAETNLRQLADHVASRLGPAPIGREWDRLVCRWRPGTAALELAVRPPDWQLPGLRQAHDRDPRLATACRVTLLTGFRLPLSSREEGWVAAFRTVAEILPVETAPIDRIATTAPHDTEIDYARDPGGHLAATYQRVGWAPDAGALIFCAHQLFVIDRADVIRFEVMRLLPAKGGGGATLAVRCRTGRRGVTKRLTITHHADPDGLTALGHSLAKAFGRTCEVGPYMDDA